MRMDVCEIMCKRNVLFLQRARNVKLTRTREIFAKLYFIRDRLELYESRVSLSLSLSPSLPPSPPLSLSLSLLSYILFYIFWINIFFKVIASCTGNRNSRDADKTDVGLDTDTWRQELDICF
jgi:hypothetical protein